ncbi:MAG: hypothetical protein OK457_09115, partial [Thaumarchaeota archaeon]|nr:hypothetical protein [Nitrososphaerota archaeon]
MTTEITSTDTQTVSGLPNFLVTKISIISGLGVFTLVNLLYAFNKSSFLSGDSRPILPIFSLFLFALGAGFMALGAISYLRTERGTAPSVDAESRLRWRLGKIISEALFLHKKLFVISAALYAVFFAFIDGIFVYQPSVDFASQYSISSPKAFVEYCCGPPGYVPVGLVYFPAQHFGIQLIPISVFTLVLVSTLVGFNVSLLYSAVKQTSFSKNPSGLTSSGTKFVGALGAGLGLFAGCPTCAAAFFLSMIAGSGATAFSVIISQYQPLIIGLSLPLL